MSEMFVMLRDIGHIRGIRNANPLNIKRNPHFRWEREVDGEDKTFCVFDNMVFGFRAAFLTLDTYYYAHGLHTLRQIIRRWAPPTENETAAYLAAVARWAELDPDEPLPGPREDCEPWIRIVRSMMAVECTPDSTRCMAMIVDMNLGYAEYLHTIKTRKDV